MPRKHEPVAASEVEAYKNMVREAQERLLEATQAVETVIKILPNEGYFRAYLVDRLKIMASADHGFLSHDANLDDVLTALDGLETVDDLNPEDEGEDDADGGESELDLLPEPRCGWTAEDYLSGRDIPPRAVKNSEEPEGGNTLSAEARQAVAAFEHRIAHLPIEICRDVLPEEIEVPSGSNYVWLRLRVGATDGGESDHLIRCLAQDEAVEVESELSTAEVWVITLSVQADDLTLPTDEDTQETPAVTL